MNAITCEGLTRSFGSVRAVDGISFSVERGSIFALLGANGAGKTTTIHLLLGLLHPDAGRGEVLGHDVRTGGDHIRAKSGALLEHNGIYERLTVEDNLEAFGRITRMTAADRSQRIRELFERFGLWERRRDRAGTLSRGMKQKLAVARALLHRPEIVFLDEPTAGLDPEAAVDLRDMIATLARVEGMSVFLNTHNLLDAEKLSTKLAIMRSGNLLAMGTPDDIRRRSNATVKIVAAGLTAEIADLVRAQSEVASAVISNGSMAIELRGASGVSNLVRLLVEKGAAIEEVRREAAGLEDAFLRIVREDSA